MSDGTSAIDSEGSPRKFSRRIFLKGAALAILGSIIPRYTARDELQRIGGASKDTKPAQPQPVIQEPMAVEPPPRSEVGSPVQKPGQGSVNESQTQDHQEDQRIVIEKPLRLIDVATPDIEVMKKYQSGGEYSNYLEWQSGYLRDHLDEIKDFMKQNSIPIPDLDPDQLTTDLLRWEGNDRKISHMVLHWTTSDNPDAVKDMMLRPDPPKDIVHFNIHREGVDGQVRISQFLEVGQAAYHVDYNDPEYNTGYTIAVECDGTDKDNPYNPQENDRSDLTDAQAQACADLVIALINDGKIDPNNFTLLGHRDVMHTNNVDPGVDFVPRVVQKLRNYYPQINFPNDNYRTK